MVDDEQRCGADQAAGDAIVFADDRVLHRVREGQQHNQIERIELRQLALARQPQPRDEKEVDDHRAQDFFRDRHPEEKHVVEQLRFHGPYYRL